MKTGTSFTDTLHTIVSKAPAPASAEATPIRSISSRLLRSVMSIYLIVTLGIFGLEVWMQYREARNGIKAELAMLQAIYHDSISYSMWTMDANALTATVSGMLKMPSVTRVVARGIDDKVLSDSGNRKPSVGREPAIISLREPISYRLGERLDRLGSLEIQSDEDIIFERLRQGIAFAVLAALAKTAALVFLVRRFFDRILSQPLYEIAERAAAIDPKAIDAEPLRIRPGPRDELGVISDAINRLVLEVATTVSELDALNKDLESQVEQRTALLSKANTELSQSLDRLRLAQESLVESEKMAALGGLVAGIAHEINTPVGLGLTGASHFTYMLDQLEGKFRAGELEEPDFERFVDQAKELSRAIHVSLEKAAALVRSFKLIAVDQSHDELRQFNVREYLGEILLTHHPVLRKAQVATALECDEDVSVRSYPGAWSQTLSNLIANSLTHAFAPDQTDSRITINVVEDGDEVVLGYRDNGRGMTEAVAKRVFDPFFTTNRQGGGSGLGMHVVYNLVSRRLHGRIHLQTRLGCGVHFSIRVPKRASSVTSPNE